MPRTVGIVVNAWPSDDLPTGTGRHAQLLGRELVARGRAAHVLVLESGSVAQDRTAREGGVEVRRVVHVRPTQRAAHRSVTLQGVLERWLASLRPDLVHVVHPGDLGTLGPALVAASGVPVVSTVCDGLYGCAMGHLVNPLIARALCRLPISLEDCADCMAAGTGLPSARFTALQRERRAGAAASATTGPFLADSAFIGAAVARALGGDHRVLMWPVEAGPRLSPRVGGPLRVGFFGAPLWRKGLDRLLDAVDGLDKVELHVHGPRDAAAEPDFAASVRARADRLGNVVWHPAYTPQDVAARMAGVDVIAVPSRAESLPGVAKEALALGRPVLAADVAGLPELVVPGETGWLVTDTDAGAWRRAVAGLDASEVRATTPRLQRGVAAYVDDLLEIYAETLAAWPTRRAAAPWAPELRRVDAIRASDPALRSDERFQVAVADLHDGFRGRAATGFLRSARRDAHDRFAALPAWLAGVALGPDWADRHAQSIIARAADSAGKVALVNAVARGLLGRAPRPPDAT